MACRPPRLDFTLRLRAARFIHHDAALELQVRQAMGDMDAKLNPPSLQANAKRYRRAREGARRRDGGPETHWVSLRRCDGLRQHPVVRRPGGTARWSSASTPTPGGAYEYRGQYRNNLYYAALGFLPHVEVGVRWTTVPVAHPFRDLVPESTYADQDRSVSARLEILPPVPTAPRSPSASRMRGGPGSSIPRTALWGESPSTFTIYHLQSRVTLGYALSAFEASRHALGGVFGAAHVSPWRWIAVGLEHDTEKWNTMLGINLGFGLRARVVLLDLEHLSFGAGWFRAL